MEIDGTTLRFRPPRAVRRTSFPPVHETCAPAWVWQEFPSLPGCCKRQKRPREFRASYFAATSQDCAHPASSYPFKKEPCKHDLVRVFFGQQADIGRVAGILPAASADEKRRRRLLHHSERPI